MSMPFINQPLVVAGADGQALPVLATGSPRGAVFRSADGRPVVQDPNTGFFRIAAAGTDAQAARSALALSRPRWQERRDQHRARLLQQERSGGATKAPPRRPTVGEYTALCLLVDFPDAPGQIDRDEVDAFCNQPGYGGFGNAGSVQDYFRDVSNGRLTYRTLVAPYYTARHPSSHYADTDVAYPVRAKADGGRRRVVRLGVGHGAKLVPLRPERQATGTRQRPGRPAGAL